MWHSVGRKGRSDEILLNFLVLIGIGELQTTFKVDGNSQLFILIFLIRFITLKSLSLKDVLKYNKPVFSCLTCKWTICERSTGCLFTSIFLYKKGEFFNHKEIKNFFKPEVPCCKRYMNCNTDVLAAADPGY